MRKLFFLFFSSVFFLSAYSQSYLGHVTQKVNLRSGPNSEATIINKLKPGTQVFIISLNAENDFFNVIDIETNNEGYVSKKFIKIGDQVEASNENVFIPVGKITEYNPVIEIFNNTNYNMSLKLNSTNYSFKPKETKNLTLHPGNWDYRASAPGVVPCFGNQYLESNYEYTWQFYIETY